MSIVQQFEHDFGFAFRIQLILDLSIDNFKENLNNGRQFI